MSVLRRPASKGATPMDQRGEGAGGAKGKKTGKVGVDEVIRALNIHKRTSDLLLEES